METWTGAFPQLLAAYEHKERFYGIWDATTRLQAEAALDEWIATIPKGQKEVWSDLVRAVELARRDHDLLRDGHAPSPTLTRSPSTDWPGRQEP